jgi:hypothetical protein
LVKNDEGTPKAIFLTDRTHQAKALSKRLLWNLEVKGKRFGAEVAAT